MNTDEKETILFVDDEESILDIANEYFQQKGYRVVTARNGVEAVDVLVKEKVDCCFTDINMPQMDGLELAEHIREMDNTIPVIVMTGYPSLDTTIRTLKNGVVDFLIKPVNLSQMELCVRRVLRERQLFIENILLAKEVEGKERLEKLSKELINKVDELNTLNKIMTEFTTIDTSTDVFRRVVDMAVEVTRADESCFYIINETMKKPFEVAVSFAAKDREGRTSCLVGSAMKRSGETGQDPRRLIMEVVSDQVPLIIPESDGARGLPERIRSFMVVPLMIREKVFGALTASVTDSPNRFNEKDLYYLSFMTHNAAYAIENLALYENIYENLFSTLYAFVKAIEAKDPYTKQHSSRVTRIAMDIGAEMGCTREELDILNVAGMLHDIGKIGIKDNILLKPGRLTPDEFDRIREHPVIGAGIVGQLGLWDREKQIIRHHHERVDGTGYPDGLEKDEIPFLSRVLSVADVYDAMASDRIYRAKMKEERILAIIYKGSGTQFDPDVVKAFQQLYDSGRIVQDDLE